MLEMLSKCWWAMALRGLAALIFGLIALIWPGITAIVLLALIAGWAIVTGVLEIASAVRLRRELTGEWLFALSGRSRLCSACSS